MERHGKTLQNMAKKSIRKTSKAVLKIRISHAKTSTAKDWTDTNASSRRGTKHGDGRTACHESKQCLEPKAANTCKHQEQRSHSFAHVSSPNILNILKFCVCVFLVFWSMRALQTQRTWMDMCLWRLFPSVPHPRKCTKCESLPTHGWAVSLAISFRGIWIFFIEGACGLCYQSATLKLKAIVSLSLDKCLWNHGCHGNKPPSGAGKRCETALSKGEITAKLAVFVDICGHHPKSKLVVGEATSKELAQAYTSVHWWYELRVERGLGWVHFEVHFGASTYVFASAFIVHADYIQLPCRHLQTGMNFAKAKGCGHKVFVLDNWRIWRNLRASVKKSLCKRCFHRPCPKALKRMKPWKLQTVSNRGTLSHALGSILAAQPIS